MRTLKLLTAAGLLLGSLVAHASTLFVAGLDNNIRELDASGSVIATHSIGFNAGSINYDAASDKLFFGVYIGTSAQYGAWSMNADGTDLTQIFSASGGTRSATIDSVAGLMFVDVYSGADNGIWRMNFDGSDATLIDNSFVSSSIGALKADSATQTLYVGEHPEHTLKTMDYSGGSNATLLSGLDGNLHQFDIDQVNQKLYMVSNGSGPIYRSDLDGSNLEIFADSFSNPLGVAVDADAGYVYIGEAGGGVERLNLDGTGRTQINAGTGSFGLALRTVADVPAPPSLALLAMAVLGAIGASGAQRRDRVNTTS